MRMRTHNIFGFAISLLMLRAWLYRYFFLVVFTSTYLTLSINWFIDRVVGHRGYRRAPYTHSFITSTIISIIIVLPYIYVLKIFGFEISIQLNLYMAAISVAFSHIILDMVTKDGVYPLWPFSRGRLSILGIRYDNPIANIFFVLISIILIAMMLLDVAGYSFR